MQEKRILRHYTVDKALYKSVAHRAIDDECDSADIYESLIDKLYADGAEVEEIKSSDKWIKGFRLKGESWKKFDEICQKNSMPGSKVLNFLVSRYL